MTSTFRTQNLLLDLPNEILLHILHLFPTLSLPKLTTLNHRLHSLVLRVLTTRLHRTAGLHDRNLVFECYAPSRKLIESYMLCDYLGTDGLDVLINETTTTQQPAGKQLAAINNLYSRFQPYRRDLERKVQWKHPAGDIPGSRTYGDTQYYGNNSTVRTFSPAAGSASPHAGRPVGAGSATQLSWASGVPSVVERSTSVPTQRERQGANWSQQRHSQLQSDSQPRAIVRLPSSPQERTQAQEVGASSEASTSASHIEPAQQHPYHQQQQPEEDDPPLEKVKVLVNLDDGDSLHQLCASVSIFIPGPRPGLFSGYKDVIKDGVVRLWRRELGDESKFFRARDGLDGSISREGAGSVKGKERANGRTQSGSVRDDPQILWVNHGDVVGIRLGVQQKKWDRPGSVLRHADDDGPVSYEVQYKEILVRTRDLLLANEQLEEQRASSSGKAMVFGTWLREQADV